MSKKNKTRNNIPLSDSPVPRPAHKTISMNDSLTGNSISHENMEKLKEEVVETLSKKTKFIWSVAWRVLVGVGIPGILAYISISCSWFALREKVHGQQQLLQISISNELTSVHSNIQHQIADEIKDSNIIHTIRSVVATTSVELLRTEIQPAVSNFYKETDKKLSVVDEAMGRIVTNEKAVLEIKNKTDAVYSSLTNSIASINNSLNTLNNDIELASQDVRDLSQETDLFRLYFDVRQGDRAAYERLSDIQLPPVTNRIVSLAKSLFIDANLYYEDFKYQTHSRYVYFIPPGKDGGVGSDAEPIRERPSAEVIYNGIYHHSDLNQRMAYINEIYDRNLLYFTPDLVVIVNKDNNLKVVSRAIVTLEKFSGKRFPVIPPYRKANKWWASEGITNINYKSPFASIDKAYKEYEGGKTNDARMILEKTIGGLAGFGQSRMNLAELYIKNNEKEKAILELQKINEECDGEIEAAKLYVKLLCELSNTNKAVEVIRHMKPYCGDFDKLETMAEFKSLSGNPEFKKLFE